MKSFCWIPLPPKAPLEVVWNHSLSSVSVFDISLQLACPHSIISLFLMSLSLNKDQLTSEYLKSCLRSTESVTPQSFVMLHSIVKSLILIFYCPWRVEAQFTVPGESSKNTVLPTLTAPCWPHAQLSMWWWLKTDSPVPVGASLPPQASLRRSSLQDTWYKTQDPPKTILHGRVIRDFCYKYTGDFNGSQGAEELFLLDVI